jgi:phosphonate transport system substrate-binding protein
MDRREIIKHLGLSISFLTGAGNVIAQQKSLQIGVVPHISARTITNQYEPLRTFLTRNSKNDVAVSTASDWQAFYRQAKANAYDIVVAPAHVARLMQTELAMVPIAAYHPLIQGIFVTEKSKRIESPQQVRAQSIVTANPLALVTIEGENWLETKHGMKKGIDYGCNQVRGNDSVGRAVLKGEGVAGMLCQSDFNAYPDDIKQQLSIIATYVELPNFVILKSRRLSIQTGSEIEKALGAFSKSAQESEIFEQRTGFRIIQKSESYDLAKLDRAAAQIRHLLL